MNNDTNQLQASSNHQNPSGGISCSQLEYYYSSPEDSKKCLSSLLERVNHKHFLDTILLRMFDIKNVLYDMTACEMINLQNKQEDIYGNLAAYYAPASNEDEIYSQLESYGTNNIPHNQIRLVPTCTLPPTYYLSCSINDVWYCF